MKQLTHFPPIDSIICRQEYIVGKGWTTSREVKVTGLPNSIGFFFGTQLMGTTQVYKQHIWDEDWYMLNEPIDKFNNKYMVVNISLGKSNMYDVLFLCETEDDAKNKLKTIDDKLHGAFVIKWDKFFEYMF